jgi:adenine-specific DNA-methyltransferase
MKDREKVAGASPDLVKDQIKHLKALFPEAVCEGKVDFEKLKATLGEELEERRERYSFTWAGKQNAIRLLQAPSRATLLPAPEESVDFDTTGNLFIEGDNLEVLKLLYKPYFGCVKMIYIDPPYNTGNDFIYPDNFADPLDTYLKLTGQQDSEGNLLTSNPETSGRYHSTWLSMMYPRLFLARQLLREDGVIFVSIDDHEGHNLRMLMNEVFGEENFIDNIIWKKRYGGGAKEKHLISVHEYVLLYARNKELLPNIFVPTDAEAIERYYKLKDENFKLRGPYRTHPLEATKSMGERKNLVYPIPAPDGTEIWPKRQWLWARERSLAALASGELEFIKGKDGWTVHTKQYLKDEAGVQRQSKAFSIIDDVFTQHGTNEIIELFQDAQVFAFPKPSGLIGPLQQIGTDGQEGDIVLDFFAGSATTAQAVLDLNREDGGNRRFILVQLPEPTGREDFPSIAEIGKERIRRVIAKLKKEKAARLPSGETEDLGFRVFKLAASHHKLWAGVAEKEPGGYGKEMDLFQDPLLPGWSAENILWEVALKEGFGLNSTIEPLFTAKNAKGAKKGKGKGPMEGSSAETKCFRVTDPDKDQHFILSLDETFNPDHLKALNLSKEDLFICRDTALTDELAANLALQCRLKTI